MVGRSHVGCSGWSYRHWRGNFYDRALPARAWFEQYTRHFCTVEINNTFYRMPPPTTFESWSAQAPAGFVYSVKVNRYGTHRLKLTQPERWATLHAERVALLGKSGGPNLVQLPPNWRRDLGRLEAFLSVARDLSSSTDLDLRWALELRDPTWVTDATFELLARYGVALCCHDLIEDHPFELTAPWAYARFHGPDARNAKYVGDYGEAALVKAAGTFRRWLDAGHDVFAYFNNDTAGAATRDAARLERLLQSG